jgi:general nucleoside transport system permease protein
LSRKLLYGIAAPVLAAVVAVVVSSIALLIAGESPRTAFLEMWKSIDSTASVVAIVNRAVPYYVAGVAVAIGFIMRLFNIGVDGQHQLAAVFAAAFGFGIGSWGLPAPLYVLSIFLVAVLVAMAWASIAAVLKVTRNVNEVISTIMLNFIASQLIFYLLREHWNRGAGMVAETGPLPRAARIPNLNSWFEAIGFDFPANVILQGFLPIAILLGIAYHIVLNRSRFGFDLRVSGQNPAAAKASGVNPKRMVLLTFLISGGIAGLIGLAPLLADPQYGKYGDQFPQGLGFTGLSLALLGRNHPVGIAAAALVWATIERATQRLSFIDIPQEIGTILQGSFLLAAVVAYEVVRRKAEEAETRAMARRTPMPTAPTPPPIAPPDAAGATA